jgi:hypothetical protein
MVAFWEATAVLIVSTPVPHFAGRNDPKQLFGLQTWRQVKARLQFLVEHHGEGLGEAGAGKPVTVV